MTECGFPKKKWLWQLDGWPRFTWNAGTRLLDELKTLQGRLASTLSELDSDIIGMAQLETLEREIMHNSLLEGVRLPEKAVRSSLFRRLAIRGASPNVFDRRAQNCMELLVEAITTEKRLSRETLIKWQSMAVSGTGTPKNLIGRYRDELDGPMRVISGPIGRERIHYEAVQGKDVEREMETFLEWLNAENEKNLVVKSALAHLHFVLIHPFGDGNGRIARTISEYIIARDNPAQSVFAEMSAQLQRCRREYDDQLDRVTSFDVSEWVNFNIRMRCDAIRLALASIGAIVKKHALMHAMKNSGCSERQMGVMHKISNPEFSGKINIKKYSRMARCGVNEARNDLSELAGKGFLARSGKNFELTENMPGQARHVQTEIKKTISPKF